MEKNAIHLIGHKSPLSSPFAVFEHFGSWRDLREQKKLPIGVYFVVVVVADKNKADIYPNLFVQGYRPHSSGAQIHVDTRRYAAFVPDQSLVKSLEDVVYVESQLYQVKSDLEVELVLTVGEAQNKSCLIRLADRICAERQLEKLSEVKHYSYACPESVGYFLKGRVYDVWSLLVGINTGFSLEKRVLIMDYHTGIPAIVPYQDKCFELISVK